MQSKSSSYHIDKSTIFMFLIAMGIASGILVYKIWNYNPCQIVEFDIKATNYQVGEVIRFKDFTTDVQTRIWDFGDTSEKRFTQNTFHTYDKPGTYVVNLAVNNGCTIEKKIVISKAVALIDSTKLAAFEIPNTIEVGELLRPREFTKDATRWEWRFGENQNINSRLQSPTYIYETKGLMTVILTVNGDPNYSTQKTINVVAKQENLVVNQNLDNPVAQRLERESVIKYSPNTTTGIANNKPGNLPYNTTTSSSSSSSFSSPNNNNNPVGTTNADATNTTLATAPTTSNSSLSPGDVAAHDSKSMGDQQVTTPEAPELPKIETPEVTKKTKEQKDQVKKRSGANSFFDGQVAATNPKNGAFNAIDDAPNISSSVASKNDGNQNPKETLAKMERMKLNRTTFSEKLVAIGQEELALTDFSNYLCDNLDIPIMYRGKKMSFRNFYSKVRGKKLKVKSLEIFKNKDTYCIEYFSLN